MRKIILYAMILLVTSGVYSQQPNAQPSLVQQDYLEKSRKQKTAAKVLSISGAGLIATGLFIPRGELLAPCYGGWFCSKEHENDDIKGNFVLAGTITMVSSIPLFIISGKNKKKAATLSFKKENTLQLNNQNLVYSWVPAVRVKLDF